MWQVVSDPSIASTIFVMAASLSMPTEMTSTEYAGPQTGVSQYLPTEPLNIPANSNSLSANFKATNESAPYNIDTRPVFRAIEVNDGELQNQQLAEFRKLSHGWDGYGAEAPSEATIHDSIALLDFWDWDRETSLELGALTDGGVSFELYSVDQDVLLGVIDLFGDGKMNFAFSVDGVGDIFGTSDLMAERDRFDLFELIVRAKSAA